VAHILQDIIQEIKKFTSPGNMAQASISLLFIGSHGAQSKILLWWYLVGLLVTWFIDCFWYFPTSSDRWQQRENQKLSHARKVWTKIVRQSKSKSKKQSQNGTPERSNVENWRTRWVLIYWVMITSPHVHPTKGVGKKQLTKKQFRSLSWLEQ